MDKKPQGLNPTQRSIGFLGKLEAEEIVFSGKNTPICCPVPMANHRNMHRSNIV